MRKIAVYGGSFDPPHKGHRRLAENLAESCGAEKVIIIPAAVSPFKDGSCASAEDRLGMCRLAFSSSLFEISDIEIKRGGKSYTVDTLREIKRLYPDALLYLFMGDDMLFSFHKWYEYEEILRLAKIVCACRSSEKGLLKRMTEYSQRVLKLETDELIISPAEPLEASSTLIRAGSEAERRSYLDEAVFDYIYQRGLYR